MNPMEGEHHDIVIVGGGICGLATALALHRRGIYSVVLEKSDTLRAEGAAIGVHINGWRALDQLGVGMELRKKAILLTKMQDEFPEKSTTRVTPYGGELRCLKRSDLVETLADNLPMNSIRFGCTILAIETDPISYFPIIHIDDGSVVKAKVLIGCDGSNSVVAKSLGMAGPKLFPRWVIRGFTNYPNGQTFGNHFFRLREGHIIFGRTPVNEKLVHWFVSWPLCPEDSAVKKDSELMRDTTLELLKEFPRDIIEMVKLCDLESLSLTGIRYRAPWDLLLGNLWRGAVHRPRWKCWPRRCCRARQVLGTRNECGSDRQQGAADSSRNRAARICEREEAKDPACGCLLNHI